MSCAIINKVLTVFSAVIFLMGSTGSFASSAPARRATLVHVEGTSLTTSVANIANGPIGPDCDATTGGSGCAFVDFTYEGTGEDSLGGPSTFTGNGGFFYGSNGANITPSGVHDGNGESMGACSPAFANSHITYKDGSTLDESFRGTTCCVGSSCAAAPQLGPISTAHYYGTCTGGSGRFAGVQCSIETTTSNTNLNVSESVMLLPKK